MTLDPQKNMPRLCKAVLLVVAAATLAACTAPKTTAQLQGVESRAVPLTRIANGALAVDANTPGSAAYAERMAREQLNAPVVKRSLRPWIGSTLVDVQSDEALPPIFYEPFNLNFDDRSSDGRVSLQVVVERLSRITKVPVRVSSDILALIAAQSQQGNQRQTSFPALSPAPGSIANRAGAAGAAVPVPQLGQALPAPNAPNPNAATSAGAVGANQQVPTLPTPSPGASQNFTDLSSVEMKWEGRDLASFLNFMTDRLGLSWSYREGVVTIQRFITETFEVSAFLSAQDFRLSLTGQSTSTGGGGASSDLGVAESGRTEPLVSLIKSLTNVVSPVAGSTVNLNEGTGRLAITTTKDLMGRVREIMKSEQESMQRQVMVQVDIYSLNRTLNDERGINWTAVFSNLQNTLGATLSGPPSLAGSSAGNLSLNILSVANGGNPNSSAVQRFGNSNLILQSLAETGLDVTHRPLTLITLNRQWARKTNLRQTGYLAETIPSTIAGAGSGAPGLKTDSVTTGDRFIVQPAILDNGSVLLKFAISLTDLISLFDVTTGSGATLQRVQTPEVAGVDDQATVRLKAGEAMVLTGLTRVRTNSDQRELVEGTGVGLGGSKKQTYTREDFLIFVRAVAL